MNMEYTQITKQVLDFQKMSFSNWYDAVALLQDQATSAMDMVLDKNTWMNFLYSTRGQKFTVNMAR